MANPESYQEIKATKWIPPEDRIFLDDLGKTFNESAAICQHLDEIIENTPKLQNPFKRLEAMMQYYSDAPDELKKLYVLDQDYLIYDPNASEYDKNMAIIFLSKIYRKVK